MSDALTRPRRTVVGIIPARYASVRFPGKPLVVLGGKPIVQRTWERASACATLDAVAIATDDERIAAAARGFGAIVLMTSPDCPSGSDRMAEAMRAWEAAEGRSADAAVNIQGDEPFIDPAVIDAAVELLFAPDADPPFDVTTAMTPLRRREDFERPDNVKVVFNKHRRAIYFSRAAIPSAARSTPAEVAAAYRGVRGADLGTDAPIFGFKHLGLYVFRREALLRFVALPPSPLERLERLEQLRMLEAGMSLGLVATPREFPGIDTPDDLARAEVLLAERGEV